jgi:uncharacterized membrane protein YcaP (DUF421 family)
MEFLNNWCGINEDLSVKEIAARSMLMFIIALMMVRFSGMGPFGKGNPYDIIIAFLIGGILSRGVVGATPFFSAIAGAFSIILFHKLIGKLSLYSKALDRLVNGRKFCYMQLKGSISKI